MAIIGTLSVLLKFFFQIVYLYLEAFVRLFKPAVRKSIAGETVLITGAGHGIGRQLALELSKLGPTVVVWDINKENNEKTAQEINASGGKAFAYCCDVTDTAQIATVAAKVREDVGEVSILVNNAGVLNGGFLMDLNEKVIRRTFEVNVLSHFWMNREFLPNMMKENHGHIFNVASMAGLLPSPVLTDYSSSKFAVVGFSKSLAQEFVLQGYTGIVVSALCPFVVDTGMLKNYTSSIQPMLSVQEVVDTAVDGLLKNVSIITVPARGLWMAKALSLLPSKTLDSLTKFGLIDIQPQFKKEN